MQKQTVSWTEIHTVEIDAKNLADAKRIVNEMSLSNLNANPSYNIEITGLPKDTTK